MENQNKNKLTLTCDPGIVEEAKYWVAKENDSLSNVVQEFLAVYVSVKKNKKAGKYPFHQPEIQKLAGAFKLGSHRDYKKELRK